MTDIVEKINWDLVDPDKFDITKRDMEKIIQLTKIDPDSAIAKMRKIIENLIRILYTQEIVQDRNEKNDIKANFGQMTYELNEKGIFQGNIYTYINTIRISGNTAVHQGQLENEDVNILLPMFLRLVEWFVEYNYKKYPKKAEKPQKKEIKSKKENKSKIEPKIGTFRGTKLFEEEIPVLKEIEYQSGGKLKGNMQAGFTKFSNNQSAFQVLNNEVVGLKPPRPKGRGFLRVL